MYTEFKINLKLNLKDILFTIRDENTIINNTKTSQMCDMRKSTIQ